MGWFRKQSDTTEHVYAEERLSAYLDGALSLQERMAVERHLARCQHCQWNFRTLRQTVQWTRELPTVPVPRAFTLPAPAQTVRAPRQHRAFVPLLQGATALVALLLVFVVVGDVMLTGFSPVAMPQLAAPMEQPAAKVEATRLVEITKEVELEAAAVVEETVAVEVEAAEVQAPPPSAVEKAVEMPTTAALLLSAPQATPTPAPEAMMEQVLAPTPTSEAAGIGGGEGLSATEAPESSRAVAPTMIRGGISITQAVEALATLFPTLPITTVATLFPALPVTTPSAATGPISTAVELWPTIVALAATAVSAEASSPAPYPPPPAAVATAVPLPWPTEAPVPAATVAPMPTTLPGVAGATYPTPAPLPTMAPESTQAGLSEAGPTTLPPAPGPTVVAEAQASDRAFAVEQGREMEGVVRPPFVGWLRTAEIVLGVAFVLLATATLVVMMRRHRAG